MVNLYDPLDRTFAALADPTRRAILAALERDGSTSVSGLAGPLAAKLPGMMKHLDVLDGAGLIRRSKSGRVVTVELQPDAMRAASAWLARYERFWNPRLDRLAEAAEAREQASRRIDR